MKGQLARAMLWCMGALPLRLNRAVGAGIGLLLWYLPNRSRTHSEANIDRCYADRSPAWRRQLLRASLIETGRTFAEAAWFWQRSQQRVLRLVREVHGLEHIDRARNAGRGIIFATPHIGAWELAGSYVASRARLTVLYRPPRIQALDRAIRRGRERLGQIPVPTDGSGVRALHRALRKGEAIGVLPDQQPRGGQGVYAPFMGQPALTMTLLSRMAARSGARVLFVAMLRRPDGAFAMHIWPAGEDIADDDAEVAATRINRETERAIALAPAQYMWNYQRFRARGTEKAAESSPEAG
ncbi:MAG: lipid A biosynthesis acyltransferase [Halofilum sp. (in: g-proteobacteria)]|nr:lipid A biosynthesis acyltransferase [Halofilum sp. (in: g-proteobacteria)]